MNIIAPLAGGLALVPQAAKMISGVARELSFSQLLAGSTSAEKEAAQKTAPEDAVAQLEAFRQDLCDRLSLAGIDLSEPVTLGVTSWGQIEVRSPHAQALEIEQMLNTDPELRHRFYQTAALVLAAPVDPQQTEALTESNALDEFELTIGS